MNEDDDVGFDLSAWEAPPPPAGIADAVIARVTAPLAAGAVEPETPRTARRWWVAGGVAAALVGALGIALAVRSSTEATRVSGSGAVAVARPSHLDLGGTAIDLEANTDVWWVREGGRMTAMQPRGAATYKVAADEQLVIDAGATVASVSASGASLRVEVEMNLSDARLIGTSAVTAAAVALVTVIVYEGHVEVTGGEGKTVSVAAGSTVEIAPNQPPVEPDRVAGLEKRLRSEIEFLRLENDLLKKKVAGTVPSDVVLRGFREGMAALQPQLAACTNGAGLAKHEVSLEIANGKATSVEWSGGRPAGIGACLDGVLTKARFADRVQGTFDWALEIDPDDTRTAVAPTPRPPRAPRPAVSPDLIAPPAPPAPAAIACGDKAKLDALDARGDQLMANGQFAGALGAFEQVYTCRKQGAIKVYLAACRTRSFAKAKVYFNILGKENYAQICMKEGFDPRK